MLEIDGSIGEGGGSILRVGAGFAVLTNTPIHVTNIRKNRDKPGLRTQHMVGLKAIADLCNGQLEGAEIGSTEVTFRPSPIAINQVDISIATAGSVGLVLQSLQIACLQAPGTQIDVIIQGGGTYGTGAPSTTFLQNVTYPIFGQFGYSVKLNSEQQGFYPKGGARTRATFCPPEHLRGINFEDRGQLERIGGIIMGHTTLQRARVCERIADTITQSFNGTISPGNVRTTYVNTLSVGVGVDLWAEFDSGTRVSTGTILGARGVSSEKVGQKAVHELRVLLDSGATVDAYLSDQLIPIMAACPEPCSIIVPALTLHATTNIDIIDLFAPNVQFTSESCGPLVIIRSKPL